ncbi:MAG: MarR family winged helix-turn-helix transcriptional regulator, partial [Acutalibacteraceae bacterium]|nr:MarR family winged helix-turn-helix transcriptional regulator [Acutalibacteraceae bacterium]
MKISDYLIISKKTITAYNKTCESVLEKYDISQVSFDILMFLTNNPEYVTAQDISEIKGIKKNLVSIHVEKLVRAGLLKRGFVSGDRRKVSLSCTEKARPIIEDGLAVQSSFYERITSG